MGRNKKQRAELLDAIVIGSKNSKSLPIVKQDVLIVWGEKDRTFTLEQANLLQQHIGEKAKLVVIKECSRRASKDKWKLFSRRGSNFKKESLL